LEESVRKINDLTVASEDFTAVLSVIKSKRADLKDTEGRLRDQMRLCSEEIGLGGRWGSSVPNAPAVIGRPALKTATGQDVAELQEILGAIDGEVELSIDTGEWVPPTVPRTITIQPPRPDPVRETTKSVAASVYEPGDFDVDEFVQNFPSDQPLPEFEHQVSLVTDPTPPAVVDEEPPLSDFLAAEEDTKVSVVVPPTTEVVQTQEVQPLTVGNQSKNHLDDMPSTATEAEIDTWLDESINYDFVPGVEVKDAVADDFDVDSFLSTFE
jgi:hypothetical protein